MGGEVSAISVGAKAELAVQNMQIKARAKAALGLGAGVSFSIDASDFALFKLFK